MAEKKYRTGVLLPVLGISLLLFTGAYRWPVAKLLLTASFGESRSDHFHTGIDLGGDGQTVHPVADGVLFYSFDRTRHPLSEPFGNGNLAAVQHTDGSRSFYFHMQDGSVKSGPVSLRTADTLGITGNTGRSFGPHLHLTIQQGERIINPLSVLHGIRDKTPPTVNQLIMRTAGRNITLTKKFRARGVDNFELLVKAWDSYADIKQIAVIGVYRAALYLNDRRVSEVVFDRLNSVSGRVRTTGGKRFPEVYRGNHLISLGSFKNLQGTHTFRVQVWDYFGNMTAKMVEVSF